MSNLKVGDLVWAKMKGFPPWPGLISEPPDGLKEAAPKKNQHSICVYFYGTHDYGWIEVEKLKPYLAYKNKFINSNKSQKFKNACKEIEEFFINNGKLPSLELQETMMDSMDIQSPKNECELSGIEDEESNKSDVMSDSEKMCELSAMEADGLDRSSETGSQTKETPGGKNTDENYQKLLTEIKSKTPSIKLNKLDILPLIKKTSSTKKKINNKKMKKIKLLKYSDPDTTTPTGISLENHQHQHPKNYRQGDSTLNRNKCEETMSVDEEQEIGNTSNPSVNNGEMKIGFIGLGVIGRGIVRNLLQAGHQVTVWNRSSEKVTDFEVLGAQVASSPGAVVRAADFIFCCVSDSIASKEVMFKPNGVMFELSPEKSYIDLTSTDVESSLDLSEAVYSKGSRYMEMRLEGSKKEADEGNLICLAAGDHSLYNDCLFFFKACSQKSFFMGETGNASKMHLILQLITGVTIAGLAESMALADRAGLDQTELIKILELSQINCPLIIEKAKAMHEGEYSTHHSVRNLQKDINYSLHLGDACEQPTPIAATANELFKHSRKLGYGGHDVASVILGARF